MRRSLPCLLSLIALSACTESESPAVLREGGGTALIISEYVEGRSFNKAVEVFNPTLEAVDLSTYALDVHFNGNTSIGTRIVLEGTLAPGQTHVLVHDRADASFRERADQLTDEPLWNGDDAVVLRTASSLVDVIGEIGFDPGTSWTGSGGTRDNTLRRNDDVGFGDAIGQDAFDAEDQWRDAPFDDPSDLGQHDFLLPDPDDDDDGFTRIHAIQGTGSFTPISGDEVTIEAVVVADAPELLGFFVQEEDRHADADPRTSEGIFVFARRTGVGVGDIVQITGNAAEFRGMTEIAASASDVRVVGRAPQLPTPAELRLPLSSPDALETVEGMRVRAAEPLFVTSTFELASRGRVLLSGDDRLPVPTQVARPGAEARAVERANALNQIVLDDFSDDANPEPIVFPAPELSAQNTLRGGVPVLELTGVVHDEGPDYRVLPTDVPVFDHDANPRTDAPPRQGTTRIASFNVLNYFNGDGFGGGFPTDRGADSSFEFARQSTKIVAAITQLDADIIALMELENDGYGSRGAIADLTDRLNDASPSGTEYAFVDPGVSRIGRDAIAVGFVFRRDTIEVVGQPAILDGGEDRRFNDSKNRPSLAVSFEHRESGERLTVAVNHLKSKGSPCNDVGDPDRGDGQGNCNETRTRAAEALVDWLASAPTGIDDPDVVILGDLNAYDREDPVEAIRDAGYTSVLGPDDYSFVFDGRWGALDHQLITPSLLDQLSFAGHWHINADEPIALDYNLEGQSTDQREQLFDTSPFRASDHDPIVADFVLQQPQ